MWLHNDALLGAEPADAPRIRFTDGSTTAMSADNMLTCDSRAGSVMTPATRL
jgi:hypothetical protein